MNSILASASWQLLDKLLNALYGFLFTILLARTISVDGYGDLIYLVNIFALCGVILHFGMSNLITQILIEEPEKKDELINGVILIKTLLASVVIIPIILYVQNEFGGVVALSTLCIMFYSFGTSECLYQAKVQGKKLAQLSIIINITFFGIKVFATIFTKNIVILTYVLSLQIITYNLALYFFSDVSLNFTKASKYLGSIIKIARNALPIYVGTLLSYIYMKSDIMMLYYFTTSKDVALYGLAAQLSEVWIMIPALITTVLLKHINEIRAQSYDAYIKFLGKIISWILIPSYILIVLIFFWGELVITSIYGAEYALVSNILLIHMIGSMFLATRTVFSKWIIIEKQYYLSIYSHGVGATLNLVLNIFLIPHFGVIGAAIATAISYFTASIIVPLLNAKSRAYGLMALKLILISPYTAFTRT
jgi:O-antigen/teichoic acid export membrane protein